MTWVTGLDLAMVVAENADCHLKQTIEYGAEVLHYFVLMGPANPIFFVADKHSQDICWVGMDVGTFPLSVELVDAVDAEQDLSGRVHGAIGDGEVRLQVRRSVRADELSVASLRRVIDENLRQLDRLRNRILGTMPRSPKAEGLGSFPTPVASAAQNIISGFLLEWRRILRHAGHRTNLGITSSGAWSDIGGGRRIDSYMVTSTGWYQAGSAPWAIPKSPDPLELSAALESTSPPDFVALRELDGKVLACGAIGALTFAVEDDADLTRAVSVALGDRPTPSVADLLSDYFVLALKAGASFSPAGGFIGEGWHRPLSLWASSGRKQIQVKTSRASQEMIVDSGVTRAATALLIDPESWDAKGRLDSSLEHLFTTTLTGGRG